MIEDVTYVDSATFPIARERTILVVDACSSERARVAEGLILCGFRVASACSVADAFYTAVSVRPDLILVAMALPSSSGIELAGSLKRDRRLRDIPIVVYGDDALIAADDGAEENVAVRPIPKSELASALHARVLAPRPIHKAAPGNVAGFVSQSRVGQG